MPMLQAVTWVDEGMVKRVRGTAYSTRVSPQMANRMIDSVRGIFNKLLPDVYIFSDHYTGHESGKYVLRSTQLLCYPISSTS